MKPKSDSVRESIMDITDHDVRVEGLAFAKVHILTRLYANDTIIFSKTGAIVRCHQLVVTANLPEILDSLGEGRRRWKDGGEALSFGYEHQSKLGLKGNYFELEDGTVYMVGQDMHNQLEGFLFPFNHPLSAECDHRIWSLQP